MKKSVVSFLLVLCMAALVALGCGAYFSGETTAGKQEIKSGTLQLSMKPECLQGGSIFDGLFPSDSWLPGEHRETLLTIKNVGSIDARWRVGVIASGEQSESLMNEIIISFYAPGEAGSWKLIRSERLKDVLVTANNDRWLYDQNIATTGSFKPIKPGQSQQLLLQLDFELSAGAHLQGKEFEGNLVLQGAQVNSSNWFPSEKTSLSVEGGEK